MRLGTFLILISFVSCFDLAESVPIPEVMNKMMSAGRSQVDKGIEKYKEGFKKLTDARLKGAGAKSPSDDVTLTQLEPLLAHRVKENAYKFNPKESLKNFFANIDKAPFLQRSEAAGLKKLTQQTATELAEKPSKWKPLWTTLKIVFGGLIAGLIFAAIYGMWE
ncbi:unnamed protein product [Peronospora destructor]|uniref:RxLR effector protein n=1 Tax=Peronospora destructor TaxID=86335 RepID=A0AAV0TBQ2_9STRA|nr:unnamed protein product [Peronospora destructor]